MRNSRRQLICLMSIIAGGILGCAPSISPESTPPTTDPSIDHSKSDEPVVSQPNVESAKVTLVEMDFAQFQDFLKSKQSKIVVVDMWATWCPPCVKGFPNLVALRKKYSEKDVACVSMSLDHQGIDPLDEVAKSVREFLQKQRAELDNILATEESDAILKKFGTASIPVVDVYGRDGKLVKRFDESSGKHFDYDEVDKFVQKLLATP